VGTRRGYQERGTERGYLGGGYWGVRKGGYLVRDTGRGKLGGGTGMGYQEVGTGRGVLGGGYQEGGTRRGVLGGGYREGIETRMGVPKGGTGRDVGGVTEKWRHSWKGSLQEIQGS